VDAKFVAIVERLVKEQGKDTLINAEKCKEHIEDYLQNGFSKERDLLLIAIEAGAGQAIADASDLALCKKQQIRLLKDDHFIDETAATEAVELLALILRDDKSQSTKQNDIYNLILVALIIFGLWAYNAYNDQEIPEVLPNIFKSEKQIVKEILNQAKAKQDLRETIALYTQAIEIDPNNASVYFDRGNAYYNLGDYNTAIDDWTQAIKINPKLAEAYYNRGVAYADLGDYNTAIDDWTQAIKIDPKNTRAYNNRGYAYYNLGDYNTAIDDWTQAIKIDPNNANAYNNRANAYEKLGDTDKAIADYTQAIKIDPNNANAYNNRGNSLYYLGVYNTAIDDWTQAIKIDPNYAKAYNNRGNAYAKLNNDGNNDQENADYSVVEKHLQALRNNTGSYSKAIADYNQAIKIDPNNANAYNSRGYAYVELGDYKKALADLDRSLKLDPNFAYAYHSRGKAYAGLKEHDKAIADFNKAVDIFSAAKTIDKKNLALAYCDRGKSYRSLGNLSKSNDDIKKARELDMCDASIK
jgi:tetratricopeptide (TPR) repeat protein